MKEFQGYIYDILLNDEEYEKEASSIDKSENLNSEKISNQSDDDIEIGNFS